MKIRRFFTLLLIFVVGVFVMSCSSNTDKVADVEKLIGEIGTVTLESRMSIIEAEKAYAKLEDAEKARVSNYSVLTEARSEYDALYETYAEEQADTINEKISSVYRMFLESDKSLGNNVDAQIKKSAREAREMYDAADNAVKNRINQMDLLETELMLKIYDYYAYQVIYESRKSNSSGQDDSSWSSEYEMPMEGESFSDYVKRVAPDVYSDMSDVYGEVARQTPKKGESFSEYFKRVSPDTYQDISDRYDEISGKK